MTKPTPSAPPAARLRGHALRSEGQPYKIIVATDLGRPIAEREHYSNLGRALCSCGALSDRLSTDGRRKQWHRDHKASLRAARSDATPGHEKTTALAEDREADPTDDCD